MEENSAKAIKTMTPPAYESSGEEDLLIDDKIKKISKNIKQAIINKKTKKKFKSRDVATSYEIMILTYIIALFNIGIALSMVLVTMIVNYYTHLPPEYAYYAYIARTSCVLLLKMLCINKVCTRSIRSPSFPGGCYIFGIILLIVIMLIASLYIAYDIYMGEPNYGSYYVVEAITVIFAMIDTFISVIANCQTVKNYDKLNNSQIIISV